MIDAFPKNYHLCCVNNDGLKLFPTVTDILFNANSDAVNNNMLMNWTLDEDYETLTEVLTFVSRSGAGAVINFNVNIINDMAVEELSETFTVNLNAASGGRVIVSGISSATVEILEDLTDSKCFLVALGSG